MDTMLSKALREFTTGPLNQLIVNLGGEDGYIWDEELKRFLRKEPCWTEEKKWSEQDGVIYFSVTSDGTTGEKWIARLESKGFCVDTCAKHQALPSSDFKPTKGVTTRVAVLKGMLFSKEDRITRNIRAAADTRTLSKPNPELACLIREKFTDKEIIEEMGLHYIVAMHEPFKDSAGNLGLLGTDRRDGSLWLYATGGNPKHGWNREFGFAFSVPPACQSAGRQESSASST